jgi:hypothetical protein
MPDFADFLNRGDSNGYLMLLSVSGLGLLCASERGLEGLRTFFGRLESGENPIGEVNKFFDAQLKAIRDTLDRLAEALEEPQA